RMMILRSDVFTSKFLLYQIVSKGFQERLRGKGTGTTVTGVSSRNFKPLDIIIAPLAEQHRIVAKIEELFSELSARNIQDGWLSLDKVDYVPEHIYEVLARRLVIEPGDVLLSCSGSVGRSCVAPINLRFALVRSVAVLKPLAEMGKFISYSIRSPLLQRQIEEKKTQTAQANIFQEKIKVLIFAIPPLSEQHKIIEEVERCLSVTEELEKVINKNLKRAEKLRQSILKKAFEGKLVPQDPTDEPADKLLERIKAEKAKREAEAKAKKKQKQPGKSQQLELF
ncbi:MAG: restriction endonuclease subunit S, partial [Coleofasciculus sp. S288]|nr:restriction endonuclease subunit S [Coleofasciculus sp. S288]